MNVWPLRFRDMPGGGYLFANDAGGFFRSSPDFLHRYVGDALTSDDTSFLRAKGHSFEQAGDLDFLGFAARWAQRVHVPGPMSYVILVPTLRCDLQCAYCQVSRVSENARGFDWSEQTLVAVLDWLSGLETPAIKIEFQGGEPMLRLDLLRAVRSFCRERFAASEFVVCTNLQNMTPEAWEFLSAEDTGVSTSFDGTFENHTVQRTQSVDATNGFRRNLERALAELGPNRVSLLPTIDPLSAPDAHAMIAQFAALGVRSIYLRPVNYQGFARKRYDFARAEAAWGSYYRTFIRALIERNAGDNPPMEEFYLSHLLRRILRGGADGHVDLRNPNWPARDYIVVDHDGRFYPTDEARMLSRIGSIDLSVGHVASGLDADRIAQMDGAVSNMDDPDCRHCVYQPYCGADPTDDLSRYGRVDLPRHLTRHCRAHLALFDLAFELLYSTDPAVEKSLACWLGVPSFSPRLAPRHQ